MSRLLLTAVRSFAGRASKKTYKPSTLLFNETALFFTQLIDRHRLGYLDQVCDLHTKIARVSLQDAHGGSPTYHEIQHHNQ
jgi:hypothetical protein